MPAWHGGLLWDDPAHLTRPDLRSLSGLWRIWTEIGATQQYYPLTHSIFWIQSHLWGDRLPGYHLLNIALHATSAFLIARILTRLAVPGALLAALLFALHPVQVESVAWISELKNTLSTALYLGAALVYLAYDTNRKPVHYAAALLLFGLALLSKTVSATLPAALLVVFWWQRGQLRWREDVLPLVPFFALGAAAGLVTVLVERHIIGAQGAEFSLTLLERVLIAGRAVWFYFGKLVWPVQLTFIYPRWEIDASNPRQYIFPVAVLAVMVLLWFMRRRSRAPLAVLLLFAAGLFPALGFADVFPFRYSFVADHFQYLASIPVLALLAAGVTLALRRVPLATAIVLPLVLVALAAMTWGQSQDYTSEESLYRATIERNPRAWMAHNNLARLLLDAGRATEARAHITQALALNAGIAEHHMNYGRLLIGEGALKEGIAHLEKAIELNPELASAHSNLGVGLLRTGRLTEATQHFERALELVPGHPEATANLASAYYLRGAAAIQGGRHAEAGDFLNAALRADPRHADAHNDLGALLQLSGQLAAAIEHFTWAVAVRPEYGNAHFNLANALQQAGRLPEAVAAYRAAAQLNPADEVVQYNLGVALWRLGDTQNAATAFREAIRLEPGFSEARESLSQLERAGWPAAR